MMGPQKQERTFDPSFAPKLLKIAEGDLATAQALVGKPSVRIENAFFLAHQVIEKAIKAVLISSRVSIPMIHDLGSLLAKLPKDCEPPYGYELNELNLYATIYRYQDVPLSLTQEDLKMVLQKAAEMLNWARGVVGPAK